MAGPVPDVGRPPDRPYLVVFAAAALVIDIGIAATLAAAAIDGGSRGAAFWLAMAIFAVVGLGLAGFAARALRHARGGRRGR